MALDGDRSIGTGAIALLEGRTAELRRMFLLKEYRGRGLGRRIAEHLLAHARDQDRERVVLGTNKHLTDPHRLYERMGFTYIPPYGDDTTDEAFYMARSVV